MNTHCRSCGSCGFPMQNQADYAGGDPEAEYCSTCADEQGRLRPFEQVLEANAEYLVRLQGLALGAARQMARSVLLTMPAWRDGPQESL